MRPLFRCLLASCFHQNSISFPPLSRPRSLPWNLLPSAAQSTSTECVSSIVNELSGLTLLEIADLTDFLKTKLVVEEMPVMGLMMPGMGYGGPSAGGAAPAKPGAAADAAKEKTAFDLQLDSFDVASKIKVIKVVRAASG